MLPEAVWPTEKEVAQRKLSKEIYFQADSTQVRLLSRFAGRMGVVRAFRAKGVEYAIYGVRMPYDKALALMAELASRRARMWVRTGKAPRGASVILERAVGQALHKASRGARDAS